MIDIDRNTRIIDLTVGELLELVENRQEIMKPRLPERRMIYGIAGIAKLFNCSMTSANRIKASGKIDDAISQCGRIITVDADLALELMKKTK